MSLRVVLAEDEPLARRALRDFVQEIDGLELVGEAGDGREAVELIDRVQPELLLLDVRMPVVDGLAVLKAIRCRPEVIFTTAWDRYAVAAFELGAIDYLVKPFGRASAWPQRRCPRRCTQPSVSPTRCRRRRSIGSSRAAAIGWCRSRPRR
ncbi:MAG: response regulator [Planctomycetes bacterium]|nr:response regulator [Planctomycetota bacterium]